MNQPLIDAIKSCSDKLIDCHINGSHLDVRYFEFTMFAYRYYHQAVMNLVTINNPGIVMHNKKPYSDFDTISWIIYSHIKKFSDSYSVFGISIYDRQILYNNKVICMIRNGYAASMSGEFIPIKEVW